jgi:hypothetical protein
MIPGIGLRAFVPKLINYADIGLHYKYTKLMHIKSTNSWSTFYIGGYNAGKVMIIFAESSASVPAIASTGFVQIGTITGAQNTLTAWYWICDDTASKPVSVQNVVGHITFYYCVYSNVDVLNPINVYSTSSLPSITTSMNAPAVTTTRNKCLVINSTGVKQAHFMGNGASAWANANLTSLTEICDYAGEVGAIVVASGFMVTAGNTGLTTFTYGTATTSTSITSALNPKEI